MIPDLPGWDSLPAVTRYHGWAEMAGIVFVALLVVAEIVAYKYGHRKDHLAEQQQIATNQRHDEEMARLHLDAAQANERAAGLALALEREHERISNRKPEEWQIKLLTEASFPGYTRHNLPPPGYKPFPIFDVAYLTGDTEAEFFAYRLYSRLSNRITLVPLRVYDQVRQLDPSGIEYFDPDGETGGFAEVMKKAFPDAVFRAKDWLYRENSGSHPTLYIWRKPL